MTVSGAARAPFSNGAVEASGAPGLDRQVFRGQEGMRTLPIEGRFESRDATRFEAEIARVQLGAVVLRRTSITAHRAIVDGQGEATRPDILRLMTVREGVILVAPPGGSPIRMDVGDALFTCRQRSYAYQANGPLVVVASTLPVSSLPTTVRRLDDLPVGPLPHSPLVDAVVDLLAGLADRFDEPWTFDADYAARGLIDLETAILTEVLTPHPQTPGPDRVYTAAVDYIERHLGEPELRPPQIADALGVSLRYLHRAFDDKEMTVARLLRERRLEEVAAALRATERQPHLQQLAARYGFGSQDQLARAFRRRYGVSMTEYHSRSAR
ncbi:MAG: helix-turn-helix domain-containing protein [Acidobacteria bacterium]|nr:helix-turn-helix domain-containing protein [Acidobacteriota bacterium]